jgi:hypothetical protein
MHEDAAIDGALRLAFVAGDDVAHDAQRGRPRRRPMKLP